MRTKKTESDILDTAKKRFKLAEDAEYDMRLLALDDQQFRIGNHWSELDKKQRAQDGRPCLTVNKIPQFVRQVTNDQRQNRPAIQVAAVDEVADPETANILKGIIRHIEYNSNADIAYDNAFDGAAGHGFGFWRIITEYVTPTSFEQEIKIKQIKDSMKVFCDPYFQEPDGSDMNWAFIVEDYSKEDYCAEYGESKLASMEDWGTLSASMADWMDADTCRVVEYYYKDYETKTICLIAHIDEQTGEQKQTSVFEDELPKDFPEEQIIQKRKTQIPIVKWAKLNGLEVLDETVTTSQYIPVLPVLGDEIIVDGKKYREGVIRHAKDPQKMLNYWVTCETETIALAPKSPWLMAEGQDEGYEEEWATANTRPHSSLIYKPISLNGQIAPPPMRNVQEAPVGSITNARMQASEDMKATTGIYDASLGARSNENSGIAIQRRNQQAQTSNFHFVDNLSRSIRHCARILIEMIPKIYDTPRAIRILGENDEQKVALINQYFEEGGKQKIYDLSAGKYDVTVDTGPSYQTRRQEAAESMLSFIQSFPAAAPLIGDLIAKNMDWSGSKEISERLKKGLLPPELQSLDGEGKQQQVPPQMQAQMQQMNQLVEQLTAQLNKAQDQLDNKTLELESKERIELLKAETDMRIALLNAQAKIGSEESQLAFQSEIAQLDRAQAVSKAQSEAQLQQQNMDLNMGIAPQNAEQIPQDYNPTSEGIAE